MISYRHPAFRTLAQAAPGAPAAPPAPAAAPAAGPAPVVTPSPVPAVMPPAVPAPKNAIPNRTLALVAAAVGVGAGGYATLGGMKAKKGNGNAKGYVNSMTTIGMVGGVVSLGILGYILINQ